MRASATKRSLLLSWMDLYLYLPGFAVFDGLWCHTLYEFASFRVSPTLEWVAIFIYVLREILTTLKRSFSLV